MTITKEWLQRHKACCEGIVWFEEKGKTEQDGITLVNDLMNNKKEDWANWLVVRIINKKEKIAYAIYAAEQVLEIFEKKHPEDKRPRAAIEAAKKVVEKSNRQNIKAAADAAFAAASDAAYAAYAAAYDAAAYAAASYAAYAAAYAAYAAAYAASDAFMASAAYAASDAFAASAADAASDAAYAAASAEMKIKIIEYGLSLESVNK